jgi:MoaD family protein
VSANVKVPTILRPQVGGEPVVGVDVDGGRSLREVLDDLDRQYPGFSSSIVAEDGALHRFVNVYLNGEDIRYLGSLETEVNDGDTVSILPAVAGG